MIGDPETSRAADEVTLGRGGRPGAAVAVVAVVVAVAIGLAWALDSFDGSDTDRARREDRAASAETYYGFGSRPELEPGAYTWRVSSNPGRPSAVVDLPAHWHAWVLGPNRWFEADDPQGGPGYAGLIVTDVYNVVVKPCVADVEGMRKLGDSAQDLVDGLATMPRHEVVAGPEPDGRFGIPATYLGLETHRAECPGDQPFDLTTSTGINDTIWSAGPGTRMDAWVLEYGARPVLVLATWDPRSPAWLVDQLHDVVGTVRLVEPEPY
jgi:hypothetical protein